MKKLALSRAKDARSVVVVLAAVLLGVGFASKTTAGPVTKAIAVVNPLGSSGVSGTVVFTKVEGGVKVSARLTGLKPGMHGFHIHEYGDCSAADGSSAGGHFNPTAEPHGGPHDAKRHAGDMGNVTAGEDSGAAIEYVDSKAAFEGPNSILGRGVIVHANPDDLKTQPTGNAGGRVACGIVGAAKGE